MDKITFLALLAEEMASLSLPDDEIEKQVNNMQRYLASISDEEFAADNPSIEDVKGIASNLYEKYNNAKEAAEEAGIAEVAESTDAEPAESTDAEPAESTDAEPAESTDAEPAEASIEEEKTEPAEPEAQDYKLPDETAFAAAMAEAAAKSDSDFFEELATEQEEQRRAEEIKQVALERAIADGAIPENSVIEGNVIVSADGDANDPITDTIDPAVRPDAVFDEFEKIKDEKKNRQNKTEASTDGDEDIYSDTDEDDPEEQKPKKKEREKIKGSPLFFVLFIVTLPITLPILAIICIVFGILYAIVTLGLIALTLLLIALIAAGTALALVGIIYGATQTVKSLPIGLTEIGIGIAIGGMTMLLGVLLYNFSIRVYPKLYKLLNRFSSFIFTKIGDLYYNCKKGCGR